MRYKHPIPGRYEVHTLQYSTSYMYNEHTVMYILHILKLQDHNRSEYSTSNVSGLDSHKEIR